MPVARIGLARLECLESDVGVAAVGSLRFRRLPQRSGCRTSSTWLSLRLTHTRFAGVASGVPWLVMPSGQASAFSFCQPLC